MTDNSITQNEIHKTPRLYIDAAFASGSALSLDSGQNHYLRNVLRKQDGDFLRVFNGHDGEWLARIGALGKKTGEIVLEECVREQPDEAGQREVHLYFSPIKKQRMDMLIEKSVELGVTDLHPVFMNRTVTRRVNEERVRAQIIEASEQCERMEQAKLHPVSSLDEVLLGIDMPLFTCVERTGDVRLLSGYELEDKVAFLIGPEGGFGASEIAQLSACVKVISVSLGENILRAETAAITCLVYANLSRE